MPWKIVKQSGARPWKVVKKTTGEVVGSCATHEKAVGMLRALYASEGRKLRRPGSRKS